MITHVLVQNECKKASKQAGKNHANDQGKTKLMGGKKCSNEWEKYSNR